MKCVNRFGNGRQKRQADITLLFEYMCRTLTAQKCILHIVLRTSFDYCSFNSANLYTLKHLNNGGSIQMTTLTPSVKYFTGGTNAPKPVSSYTTRTMRHIRHSPKKLEMLSYPHRIDCTRLTIVCYGSFIGSETLETY